MSQDPGRESHARSILKAVTWRSLGTVTTFTLAYTVFSQTDCDGVLEKSSIVTGMELVLKFLIYYLHERAWQAAPRGSVRKWFRQKIRSGSAK